MDTTDSPRPARPTDPLADSGLVIIDKPQGLTSHDVVATTRRAMKTKKVGHAGTLDPMATGVLVTGINRGTKTLAHLVGLDKTYRATIRFGMTTTTEDAAGEETSRADASGLTRATIDELAGRFTGDIMQKPSSVSAIKIAGKRAHQRVREGEEVDIPARPVTISRLDVVSDVRVHDGYADVDVVVDCSSGTYIRALARDLGQAAGTGAHLGSLRRTAVGPFTIGEAITIDQLEADPAVTITIDEALARCYPRFDVSADQARALAQGKWLDPVGLTGVHAAVGPDGKTVALVKESGKRLATVFVARPSTL
ncbi:tRNA pseudouridine(55) synthase TruB [Corynebacterium mendelii]|uniref:tRNA pseudouridine synthase B n=1 Tax=Corynebacterium mendelii TaxID=2765362 RepID=A0A939E032_9CORY|nr:tRNA pseudouridine(55) synthase TruB [Corynebacterium mendelii]MBN9643276.1 tRNA pseudouridine(55) synthase TruB [Corynebacterium mendelii]